MRAWLNFSSGASAKEKPLGHDGHSVESFACNPKARKEGWPHAVWCDGDAPLRGLKVRSGMGWDGDHCVFVLDQNHGREARPD
jgi:hypothetical protein